MTYPERICPQCGRTFEPNHKRQVYDTALCRVKSNRAKRKGEATPPPPQEFGFFIDEIQKVDPVAAQDLVQMAHMLATAQAEKLITTAYRLMTRGGYLQAKNVLLNAGVLVPPSPRKKIKPPVPDLP